MTNSQTPATGGIWYPWQRALRTAFSTVVTLAPLVPQVLAVVQDAWPTDALAAVAAQAVLINLTLSRIMALPVVDAALKKIGLGSAPLGK